MGKAAYIEDFHQWEREFEFHIPVTVRFSETDMFGHMNNTVPFVYFEAARIEFFQAIGLMQEWTKPESETIPVVADLQCDFLQQIFFDEKLTIYVKAQSVGNSSVDLHYLVKKEDGSAGFVGRGTMVQISKRTGRGVVWTKEMRNLLVSHKKVGI
ncbi:thioesterase family protein [Neobacillus novalis]|uniref:Thioesterase family protein n=1 Tax=Neobacillus novalis TaxID=220687 RepID=A0AA95MJB8_9BACI|nr:thioesterase family protein [Neobacillus novalis]WHY84919.1 thioesterase family protein [Neobacillus novalis]